MQELKTSEALLIECIKDLFLTPRALVEKWSKITNQTSQVRIAYPGQHLASVITGIKGTGTAARGDDLSDGSEVKTCSRADQLSECRKCKAKVLVWQKECANCGSKQINIKTDSHWIFSIKSDSELSLLLNKVPRIILILFDKERHEADEIMIRTWIINPKDNYVKQFFTDYFENNYLKKDDPAPCNLHPLKYDFFLMNPKLIFHAKIKIREKEVEILFWGIKRPKLESFPIDLLTKTQRENLFKDLKKEEVENLKYVPTDKRHLLQMKKKILKTYKNKYKRR